MAVEIHHKEGWQGCEATISAKGNELTDDTIHVYYCQCAPIAKVMMKGLIHKKLCEYHLSLFRSAGYLDL